MRTAAQLRTKSEHLMAFATKGTARYYGGAYGMTQLTLPEVLRIIDMVIDRPTYFKETLMVVDVLEDSADDVVRKISKSFASKSTHALEMGAGNSDANVAMQAWKLHMVLTANSATLWKRDAFLMTWAAIFTLFGTVSAVLIAVILQPFMIVRSSVDLRCLLPVRVSTRFMVPVTMCLFFVETCGRKLAEDSFHWGASAMYCVARLSDLRNAEMRSRPLTLRRMLPI
eukprot:TRINITY_DN20862_c0_g1_i11.p1 TRINITY_DN20862_c0_g1~~TRINITY_DN20862_c0_g1_i11.p1  ORF type:complete len:227 (+),score=18.53 TRINITY_DN20862_c0_g1_i11:331-1011(+)